MSKLVRKAIGSLQAAAVSSECSPALYVAIAQAHATVAKAIDDEVQKAEAGFYINGVHVYANIGQDGAVVVWCDTTEEPTPNVLRVNVNDGGVFNYPDET